MEHQLPKAWTVLCACTSFLDTWYDESVDDYHKAISAATAVDCFLVQLDALGADALQGLRALTQHAVNGNSLNIYQGSAFRARINTEAKEKGYRAVVAAMAFTDEQRCPSSLENMLSAFV